MKRTLVAMVEDKPGALNRVVSLFRRRNFNIESLTVGHSEVSGRIPPDDGGRERRTCPRSNLSTSSTSSST